MKIFSIDIKHTGYQRKSLERLRVGELSKDVETRRTIRKIENRPDLTHSRSPVARTANHETLHKIHEEWSKTY